MVAYSSVVFIIFIWIPSVKIIASRFNDPSSQSISPSVFIRWTKWKLLSWRDFISTYSIMLFIVVVVYLSICIVVSLILVPAAIRISTFIYIFLNWACSDWVCYLSSSSWIWDLCSICILIEIRLIWLLRGYLWACIVFIITFCPVVREIKLCLIGVIWPSVTIRAINYLWSNKVVVFRIFTWCIVCVVYTFHCFIRTYGMVEAFIICVFSAVLILF